MTTSLANYPGFLHKCINLSKSHIGDITSSVNKTAMHQIMAPSSHWQQSSNMLLLLNLKQNLQLSFTIVKMQCLCSKHSRKKITISLKLLSQLITPQHMDSLLTPWFPKHQKPWTWGSTGSNAIKPSNNLISNGKKDQQTLLTTTLNIILLNTIRKFATHVLWTTLYHLYHTHVSFPCKGVLESYYKIHTGSTCSIKFHV